MADCVLPLVRYNVCEIEREKKIQKQRQVSKMELSQVSEFMTTDEITEALADITNYASIVSEAIDNRLNELDYSESTYEDGTDAEIENLLDMRNTLDTICGV